VLAAFASTEIIILVNDVLLLQFCLLRDQLEISLLRVSHLSFICASRVFYDWTVTACVLIKLVIKNKKSN